MKLAIPVNEDKGTVCPAFGRTPFFLIFDTQTKNQIIINNTAAASQGGAGIKAAQTIVDKQVKAVLTPRCGENAANVLNAAGVKIYKTTLNSAAESIQAFVDEKLDLLLDIHPGFHNGGK